MLHVLVLPVRRESTERQGEDFSFVAHDLKPADATNTTTAKVNLSEILLQPTCEPARSMNDLENERPFLFQVAAHFIRAQAGQFS